MSGTRNPRRRSKSTRGADALMGYLIPVFFVLLASYQQVTKGHIDREVFGALVIFGLGALGWRLDLMFGEYLRAKYGAASDIPGDKS